MYKYYRVSATMLMVATSLVTVGATTGTANAASMTMSSGPTVNLVVDGTAFDTANGTTITVRGTALPTGATGERASTTGSCYISASPPHLIDVEGTERRINTTANFSCPGAPGRVELTVGLQQLQPSGVYVDDKYAGPVQNPAPLIILGVNSDPKHCALIGAGLWRGRIHPMLITDVCIYDFGWWITTAVRLSC